MPQRQTAFLDKVTLMLRHYREHAGLSQGEIAEILKIGVRSYQRYEAGESIPSVDLIFSLSEALKFDLKDFFAPHETACSLPGFKIYKEEERAHFTDHPLIFKSGLVDFFNSEAYWKIVKRGDIKAIRENPFFKNSSFPLILASPKTMVFNPTARKLLDLNTDVLPALTGQTDIRSSGMIWSTLMDTEVCYFDCECSKILSIGKICLKTKSIFNQYNRSYFVLSVIDDGALKPL